MLSQVRIELETFKLKPLKGFRKGQKGQFLVSIETKQVLKIAENSKGLELSKMSLISSICGHFLPQSTKYLLLIHRQ